MLVRSRAFVTDKLTQLQLLHLADEQGDRPK
jgi:hypothetical protein